MGFLEERRRMVKKYKEQGQDISGRMTGYSTAIALETIAKAMKNAGSDIRIEDRPTTSIQMERHLMQYIMERIEQMQLEGFTFNKEKRTIRYNYR